MEDSKRMIIGFILIFVVMVVFQFLFTSEQSSSKRKKGKSPETVKKETVVVEKDKSEEIDKSKLEEEAELRMDRDTVEMEIDREEIAVSNSLLTLFINPVGGVVDSVYLKEYDVTIFPVKREEPLLSTAIIQGRDRITTEFMPFQKTTIDSLKDGSKRITFTYMKDTLEFNKIYTISDSSYLVKVKSLPRREYLYRIRVFDTGEEFSREDRYSGTVYSAGKKPNTIGKGDLFEGEDRDISGAIDWVGYKTKYFFTGVIPERYLEEFTIKKSRTIPQISVREENVVSVYFGPLHYSTLSSVKTGLEDAIYFGWTFIRPISKGIYHFMKFLHKYLRNYGFVIIVFAFCMVLVLSPLTLRTFRSMGKMQDIQPKLQEIRERYKDDPQRMNKEMMELYREAGVNPFSSCLPLFLQFPIFFSLYSVLNSSIELKGAPFILWIQDLSLKDPYYILPVLMGLAMFVQQRFARPSGQAGGQQRIFSYIMPVILTFFFLTFPAGLTLYWLTYNILMIFIHFYIQKT